jgi:hypothetical protein
VRRDPLAERRARPFERPRDREELGAIRHLDRSTNIWPGWKEGAVHVELRTAAAEAQPAESPARLPPQPVAGMSISIRKNGIARAGALQHRQPGRRLLERRR